MTSGFRRVLRVRRLMDEQAKLATTVLSTPGMVDGILEACAEATAVPEAAEELRGQRMRDVVRQTLEAIAAGKKESP